MEKGHGHLVFFKKNGNMSPEYQLYEGELCIGSNTGNEIRLKNDNPLLLGVHAIVKIGSSGIATIISKSKEAPVTVNDQPVRDSRRLANSDIFEILGKKFQYFNENVSTETVKELDQNEEISASAKPDISRKSCMPALKLTPKNSPPSLKTKTPVRKPVSRKSVSENNPEGLQVFITPDKKPNKKGGSKTTSKIIVSKALGSPGNKRRTRLSLNEMPSTSETENMISSRNVLLSKSTINITISQTHEYSPVESPLANTVQKILDSKMTEGYRTKSGRTPRKSVKLREIEESPKKSMDLINFNTPDQEIAASPAKSTPIVATQAPKTPINKRLQLLKGRNSATKKDTPPPGKGSPIIHRSAKSQTKSTVKRVIKMLSPKEKGNISVTFSPNSLPSSSNQSLNFDTPGKQGSILKKTDTSGAANKSRVSFAANQSISYFQNDSSLEENIQYDRSHEDIEETMTTKRVSSRKNSVQELEHNYSIPSEFDVGLETTPTSKGRSTRNTSTPLNTSVKNSLSTSTKNASPEKMPKRSRSTSLADEPEKVDKTSRKSVSRRTLSSSEIKNHENSPRKSVSRRSLSLSANETISSQNVDIQKATSRNSRPFSNSTVGIFDEDSNLSPDKEKSFARQNDRFGESTLNALNESTQKAPTPKKSFSKENNSDLPSKSPKNVSIRRSRKTLDNIEASLKVPNTLSVDSSGKSTTRKSVGRPRTSQNNVQASPRNIHSQSSWELDESLRLDESPTRRSTLNKNAEETTVRRSIGRPRKSAYGIEENIDSLIVKNQYSNDAIPKKSRLSSWDESLRLQSDIDSPRKSSGRRSTQSRKSKSDVSTYEVDFSQEENINNSMVGVDRDSLRQSLKVDDSFIKILDMDTQEIIKSSPADRRSRSLSTSKVEKRQSKKFGDLTVNVLNESTQEAPQITQRKSNLPDLNRSQHRKNTSRRSKSVDETTYKTPRKSSLSSWGLEESLRIEPSDNESPRKSLSRRSTQGRSSLTHEIKGDTKKRSVSPRKSVVINEVVKDLNASKRRSASPRKSRLRDGLEASPLYFSTDDSVEETNERSTRKSKSVLDILADASKLDSSANESSKDDNISRRSNKSIGKLNPLPQKIVTDFEFETAFKENARESNISKKSVSSPKSRISLRKSKSTLLTADASDVDSSSFENSIEYDKLNITDNKSVADINNSRRKSKFALETSTDTESDAFANENGAMVDISKRNSAYTRKSKSILQDFATDSECEATTNKNASKVKTLRRNDISTRNSKSLLSGSVTNTELDTSVRKRKSMTETSTSAIDLNSSTNRSTNISKISNVSSRRNQSVLEISTDTELESFTNENATKANISKRSSKSILYDTETDSEFETTRNESTTKYNASASKRSNVSARKSKSLLAQRETNTELDTSANESFKEASTSKRGSASPRKTKSMLETSTKTVDLDSSVNKSTNVSKRTSKSILYDTDTDGELETTRNKSTTKYASASERTNVSTRKSKSLLAHGTTDTELNTSADESFKEASTSKRRSASPRKTKSMLDTSTKTVDYDSFMNKSTNISKRSSLSSRKDHSVEESKTRKRSNSPRKSNSFLQTSKISDDFDVSDNNQSAESGTKRSSKSAKTSTSIQEYLSPIKTDRRSSARRIVLNESSLTSAGEDQSSTSALTISSQSFSSFKKLSTDTSNAAESPVKDRSSRRSKSVANASNDSVFLNESSKSNRSTRSNKFGDNVSFTSTPFHKKMDGNSEESEIINVTSTSSVLSSKAPSKKSARSEIFTISSGALDESPIKDTSGRKSRQSTITPLLKRKSVNLEPQTPEMNREVEDETPKSHIKPRRSSKSVYNPVTEDITPVTPEKLMVSQQGETAFKTPINTPGLFESIRKSAIRSRKRARESQGSTLDAKRPRVEFGAEEVSSEQHDEEPTLQPKIQKSPRNRLSNFEGVRRLMKSPQKSPKNDLRNVPDLRPIMTSKSPKNDLTNIPNLKRIMSPRNQNSPLNDLTKPVGVKNLMKTPKNRKGPLNELSDLDGVASIFNVSSVSGVDSLHQGSDIENFLTEDLFTKVSGKKAPRTYKSLSPKKIQDTTDSEIKLKEIPACSPRVEQWVEEQVKITEVSSSSTKDELFPSSMPSERKTRGKSFSPRKSIAAKATVRKTVGDAIHHTPEMDNWRQDPTKQLLSQKLDRKSSINRQSLLKQEIVSPKTQETKRKSSIKREAISPKKEAPASPQKQSIKTRQREPEVVTPAKTTRGKKKQESVEIDEPEPSKPVGRRKRVLSEDEINIIVPIEQPAKKGRARRGVTIEEDTIVIKEIQTKTTRGKKAVPKVNVSENETDQEEFKKPQRGGRNITRGRNKKESDSETEVATTDTITAIIVKKPIRGGKRGQKVVDELKENTSDINEPKKRGGKKQAQEQKYEAKQNEIEAPVESPKRKGGKRLVETTVVVEIPVSSNVDTPIVDSPKKKRGGRKPAGEFEVAVETAKTEAPIVESPKKKRGGRKAQEPEKSETQNTKVETSIVDSPKKTGRGKKTQIAKPDAATVQLSETPVESTKKPLRAGRGQAKTLIDTDTEEVKITMEPTQKKPARGRKQVESVTEEPEQIKVSETVKPTRGRKKQGSVTTVESPIKETIRSRRKVETAEKVESSPTRKPARGHKRTDPEVQMPQVEEPTTESPVKKPTRGRKKKDSQVEVTKDLKTIKNPKILEVEEPEPVKKPTRGRKKLDSQEEINDLKMPQVVVEPATESPAKKPTKGRKKLDSQEEPAKESPVKKPTRGRKKLDSQKEEIKDLKTIKNPKNKVIEDIKAAEVLSPRSPRTNKGKHSKYLTDEFVTPEKKTRGKRVHFEEIAEEKINNIDEGNRRSKRTRK